MLIDARKVNPVVATSQAAASTGEVVGAASDMQNLEGFAAVLNVTEATGLTSATMKLTECATVGGTYTDVAADGVVGAADGDTEIALTDVGVAKLSYSGILQFVKPVVTVVATDVDYNVVAVSVPNISDESISIPG